MIKTDCIHFPLDRPCKKHKETSINCSACREYSTFSASGKSKILIIKLGAMGDVLRTTFLAEGLKRQYPNFSITWIVAKGSESILDGNPNISRIWTFDTNIFQQLAKEKFELVINLDLSPESLFLATIAFADKKIGYWLDNTRKIVCSNISAAHWLIMSGSDEFKKKNKKTYQHWMSKIAGLPRSDYEIFVPLKKESLNKAKKFALKHKIKKNNTVVGINPGAGKRWKMKKWTNKGFVEIINKLAEQGIKVLLFGGPEEKELIKYLVKKTKNKAVNTGTENSINDFFALLNLCDVVVCGDTLALHAALGLKKKVLAIFGPTSANEIEMYSKGIKIVSPAECITCYRQTCEVKPTCMELISVQMVMEPLQKLIKE